MRWTTNRSLTGICLLGILGTLCTAPEVAAQADSSIAGVVRDETGAVLPGVVVEASSPALIEKVRTAISDGSGQYKIVALRPGEYSVTFSLSGFNQTRRDGVMLTASFTAQVNAEMGVGNISESVIVSGQSPVIDVQNVVRGRVIDNEFMDKIPSSRILHQLAQLIPGATIRLHQTDVGGSTGEAARIGVSIYGGREGDQTLLYDGMRINGMAAAGGVANGLHLNPGATQEVSFETTGISAETEMGGIRSNVVPKDGGNMFAGIFAAAYTNGAMQSNNLDDDLRARGLPSNNTIDKIWDINPNFGGPLIRDRLWFYTGFRYWGSIQNRAGTYYAKDLRSVIYEPDLSRPAIEEVTSGEESLRLTLQATRKDKFSFHYEIGQHCTCFNFSSLTQGAAISTPESSWRYVYPKNYFLSTTWTSPRTNRMLLEGAASFTNINFSPRPQPVLDLNVAPVRDLATNINHRGDTAGYGIDNDGQQWNQRFSGSYVTGSHNIKIGVNAMEGVGRTHRIALANTSLFLNNGVPSRVQIFGFPLTTVAQLKANVGVFAQDQWTLRRLTINAGLRFDYVNSFVPAQELPAVQFLPARSYGKVPRASVWSDVNPRLGFAYDLGGTGKTAIKANIGRYMIGTTTGLAGPLNPANQIATSAVRSWTDTNGNLVPDCDLAAPDPNGECPGTLNPRNFGGPITVNAYDPDVREGWFVRPYNWLASIAAQHEIVSGLSVTASYNRRWYGNFTRTDNRAVTPENYDPFCLTAPVDARLGTVSGQLICGLYDINPKQFGLTDNLVTFSNRFGRQTEVFDGVDMLVNGTARQLYVTGGLSTGRTQTDNCVVVDSPDLRANPCRNANPFWNPQFKLAGSYPLPFWDLRAGASFQTQPGPQITASYAAPNSIIRDSLKRDLALGPTGTFPIELLVPGSKFSDRITQLDLRLSKTFSLSTRRRVVGNLEMYNALNANPPLALNTTYGSQWLRPLVVLQGRLLKFSMQMDF